MTKPNLNLSQQTFGSSPACVYLADLLNRHQGTLYRKLHKNHRNLKEILNQLKNAWTEKILSTQNFSHLLNLKREEFKNSINDLLLNTIEANKKNDNLDIALINEIIQVYSNVMISEINKLRRETQYTTEVTQRSLQRARSHLKYQTGEKVLPRVINTYGVLEHFKHPYASTVYVESHAQATLIDITPFKDPVSNEDLMKRSLARRERKAMKERHDSKNAQSSESSD